MAFGYGFYAPTGRFSAGAKDNIGFGFWTQQLQLAAALNFDDAHTCALILVQTWEVNSKVRIPTFARAAGARSTGRSTDCSTACSRPPFSATASGSWTTTAARISRPCFAGVLDQVYAAGFELGIPKYGVSVKYLHEFEARQRFQGQVVTMTFGLPLDPIVEKVAALVQ